MDKDAHVLAEDLISKWHDSPIYEYMKLSWKEYKHYVETNELPEDFVERHNV